MKAGERWKRRERYRTYIIISYLAYDLVPRHTISAPLLHYYFTSLNCLLALLLTMKCIFIAPIAICGGLSSTAAFSNTYIKQQSSALYSHQDSTKSRRETLKAWTSAAFIASSLAGADEALAFPNKISDKYDSRPKQRGAVPKGLGVATRKDMGGQEYLGLKPCGAGE